MKKIAKASEVKAFERQAKTTRAAFKKLSDMQDSEKVKAYLAAQDAADYPSLEQKRWSKISDIYENITNYLSFLKGQISLLDAAQASDLPFDMPDLAWTFVELDKKIEKIEALKEEWFNLNRSSIKEAREKMAA